MDAEPLKTPSKHAALDEAMEAVRAAVKGRWIDEGKPAEIELTKADAVAHEAVADVEETSRELREKIGEMAAPTEDRTALKDTRDPTEPQLPPVSTLIVARYDDEE
jgi:hypothetical protein